MSLIRTHTRLVRASAIRHIRSLATPATSGPTVSKKTTFTASLADGPSLDDFISGDVPERVVLGNKNTYVVLLSEGQQPDYVHALRSPRLPSYLKTSIPTGASFSRIKKDLRGLGLHTVCEEARCPNIGDCWGGKEGATPEESKRAATATIMVAFPVTSLHPVIQL
jgi:lipoic acid synthetase